MCGGIDRIVAQAFHTLYQHLIILQSPSIDSTCWFETPPPKIIRKFAAHIMAIAVEQVVPSHQRCAPGSINLPVAKFPDASFSSETVDPGHVASQFVKDFNQLLQKRDLPSIAGLFTENGFWRDHLALSWNFRTVQSPRGILEYLEKSAGSRNGFRLQKIALDNGSPERSPLRAPVDGEGAVPGVRTFLTLKTSIGKGTGLVRLVEENGSWKAFTLYTRLDELSGHEEAINDRRPFGADHAAESKRKNWADERREETSIETGYDPDVLIIGRLPPSALVFHNCNLTTSRCWPGRAHGSSEVEDAWGQNSHHRRS